MYGSSRLGIVYPPKDHVIYDTQFGNNWDAPVEQMNVGLKRYEISNHLGNVLASITARPVGVESNATNGIGEFFEPSLANIGDYCPFAILRQAQNRKSEVYPSGFNGQEKDDEIAGVGNFNTALYWEYDTRLGRRWNVDPLNSKYPHQTPYGTFNNNPIYYIDSDGKEGVGAVDHKNKTITIKAVYFLEIGKSGFNGDNYNQLKGVNATLNSKGYFVTDETNSLHGYSVQFDLKFVPVTSAEDAQNFATSEQKLIDNNSTDGQVLQFGGLNIGNSIILTDNSTFNGIPSIVETAKKNGVGVEKVLGITDELLQHINIPERSRGVVNTVLHEIFHTLYFDKDGSNEGIGSGKELPSNEDINSLVKGLQDEKRIIEQK